MEQQNQNHSQSSLDIYEACLKCSELLTEYLRNPSTPNKDEAEDLQSRFNLWAAYTGAFAAADASLDDRLKFHDEIRVMVLKLLSMLQRNLRSAIERRQVAHTTSTSATVDTPSPVSPDSESIPATQSYHGLQAVSAALDRLHRLATAIRRSSVTRSEKLSTSTMPSEEDAYFETCIFNFIQGRFPAARLGLIKQLTAALCFHRKRLAYQSRHNKKLAYKRQQEPITEQDQTIQSLPRQGSDPQLPVLRGVIRAAASRVASSGVFSRTNASIPSIVRLNRTLAEPRRPTPSIASTGTATVSGETYFYPEPPSPRDRRYLPCPYCAETLDVSKLDMARRTNVEFWRNHLNEDLHPYFCIADECRNPLRFFVDYEAWLGHITNTHPPEWPRSIHGTVWVCNMCSEPPPLFNGAAEFELHMSSTHGDLTKSQKFVRTKRSRTRALRDQWVCPLCDCIPSKLSKISPNEQDTEARAVFEKHIGSHLKALSLLSFRFHSSEQDDGDLSGVSTTENVSTEAILPEADEPESWKDSHIPSSGGTLYRDTSPVQWMTKDEEDLEPPQLPGSGSWDFMPNFEYLPTPDIPLPGTRLDDSGFLEEYQAIWQLRSTDPGHERLPQSMDPPGPSQSTEAIIAVMGRRGAGKTSLVQSINGRDDLHLIDTTDSIGGHSIGGRITAYRPDIDTHANSRYTRLTLLEFPGFTRFGLKEQVEHILAHLDANFRGRKLHGIIYAFDITRPQFDELDPVLTAIMERLCELVFCPNLVLATTH
ncbi:hypothetical protein A1O3_00313 [Capronia epimyces CBS 606.96]|uniref:G domain-containing protein n=1 Tax=Capronia epimyces CBS 606.96 TaxID=1182542 RepID=W9YGT3_9EURO|nr:uncharacterized protein A1O3_00313 [Capronia epimyces CBS 606.96]EXJ91763.1 hypothetical protein A1O3_00313 [Capronia epimyces CBS 606.96]